MKKRGPASSTADGRAGLFLAIFALGCAQIAGTDDYAAVAAAPEPPPLPFLAGSEECDACAAEQCEKELAQCDGDAVCSSWLSDLRAHPDPASAYERYKIEGQLWWEYRHTMVQPSYEALYYVEKCAANCLEACKLGQNFECVAKFDWEIPTPTRLRARVSLHNEGQVAEVSACLNADQCEPALLSVPTDEDGFVEMKLDSDESQRGPTDYLRVVRAEGAAWQYSQTRPLGDNDFTVIVLFEDMVLRQWAEDFGAGFVDEMSTLVVVPVDCADVNAKQVFLEAWSTVGNELVRCESCSYAYARDATQAPSTELQGFQTAGNAGYIVNVPPGVVYVVLRPLDDPTKVLAVGQVVARAGEVRSLKLYPASKRDLTSFSDPRK